MKQVPASDDTQAYLDQVLDRVLRAWSNGENPTIDELAQDRPELHAQVREVVRLASETAVVQPMKLPAVPGHRILREIGRGGMGVVYLAHQTALDRTVALKVLPNAAFWSLQERQRFRAEARAMGRIQHPNVVRVHEAVETDDLCAYSMEWVSGRTLDRYLAETDETPSARAAFACNIGIALAKALGEVHRHGLVHRDVKPSNVLLRPDGTPLLADFGLARGESTLTRTGQFVGTIGFAPPEQLRGERHKVGPASDIFGLGATLHYALTGASPFEGSSPTVVLRAMESGERTVLTKMGVSRDLDTVIEKCLEPQAADRYESAGELGDDLERLLSLRPIRARRPGSLSRAKKALRRHRAFVIGALGSALLFAAGIGATVLIAKDHDRARRAAIEHVRQARMKLLDPTHVERVLLSDRGEPLADHKSEISFRENVRQVVEHYRESLQLASDAAVANELEVVLLAESVLKGGNANVPEPFARSFPATSRAYRLWREGEHKALEAENPGDRRLLGLLAFLTGRVEACHAAWQPFELEGHPFIDAASGQLHLARDAPGPAYPRLQRALDTWPDAGFLSISVADCALRVNDLNIAEKQLDRAQALELKDPFGTFERVRADLHAARGEVGPARQLYEQLMRDHRAVRGRVHFARLLEREGDLQRALWLYIHLVEREPDAERYARELTRLADRWWSSLPLTQRVQTIANSLPPRTNVLVALSRIARTRGFEFFSESSPTPGTGSSDNCVALLGGRSATMEVLLMDALQRFPRGPLSDLSRCSLGWACAVLDTVPVRRILRQEPLLAFALRTGLRPAISALAVLGAHPGFLFGGAALVTSAQPSPAQPCLVFSDPDFSPADWDVFPLFQGTSSYVATQEATGGNPGSYRKWSISWGPGDAAYAQIHRTFRYDPAVSGPLADVTVSFDLQAIAGGGSCQTAVTSAANAVIRQGTTYFVAVAGIAAQSAGWTSFSASAATFGRYTPPNATTRCSGNIDPSIQPDLSANGLPLEFGFLDWRCSNTTCVRTSGHDNFQVELQPSATCTFRNGSGLNLPGFDCVTPPILGTTWTTGIPTTPTTKATWIALGLPGQVPYAGGELLLGVFPPPLFFPTPTPGTHSIALPASCTFLGVRLSSQGFRVDCPSGTPTLVLLNAQDLSLGM